LIGGIFIQISEIFFSLQGEGPASGKPSVFIRFSNCNLHCVGGDENAKNHKVNEWDVGDVSFRVKEHLARHGSNCRIVVTGGEPCLQLEDLTQLVDKLSGTPIDLETNGTISLPQDLSKAFSCIVVSPKKDYVTKDPKTRREFFGSWRILNNVYFKFVVGSASWMWSESEIKDLIKEFNLNLNNVWLMPGGIQQHELSITGPKTWKSAMRLNCNFSDRLHIRNLGK
jgi:organic radical activating enzyme